MYLQILLTLLSLPNPTTPQSFSLIGDSNPTSSSLNFWFTTTPIPTTTTTTPSQSYTALQSFKSSITSDPTNLLSSWVGPNLCSYNGIFCSSTQTILSIDLNRAHLKGHLHPSLSLLHPSLSLLHLNSNSFSGDIPTSFSSLTYLTELDLSNNNLSGPFPTHLLSLPKLLYLDLRFNSFSGPLPFELFQTQIDAIFLNNNHFEGSLPISLWSSSASVINLANNHLSGPIPMTFAASPAIKELLFLNNNLTGCVPEGIGYLSDIQVLDLSFNSLTGRLPSMVSCLSGIEVLNVGHNRLSGVLPDIVCELKRLENLTVAYNFFSGFSGECGRLGYRNVGFDFEGNCMEGKDLQRPMVECVGVGESGLSCFRIPSARNVMCGGGGGGPPSLYERAGIADTKFKVSLGGLALKEWLDRLFSY
ncbi:Pollen-specific leucine-rich repeat extensin-like protein 1 [Acorus gramineus]|uniref:Cell wall hydroxyproline-rich glycoprotein n=1 Tax=Acorus gramineus TaxID=55184 RepID=A0AAV9AQ46_ACOGR|nr:Pollen-specific leucine-rich repeat extensin-like protein 1 [Acorus gramineus]